MLNLPGPRLCVVRSPYDRALSGFNYLCKSNAMASEMFLRQRLHLNAFGFDWDRMPGTEAGFTTFLDYIGYERETFGASRQNDHWRTQTSFIQPKVYAPTLVGRIEDMAVFYEKTSELLEVPALTSVAHHDNRQDRMDRRLLDALEVRRRIETLYQEDFESFGY